MARITWRATNTPSAEAATYSTHAAGAAPAARVIRRTEDAHGAAEVRWCIMKNAPGVAVAAVILGFIAIVMAMFLVLALSDIAKGEPDLTLEWTYVRFALATMVASQVLSLAAVARFLRGRGG